MYRVLIVDDEEPVLESYGFILESGVDGFSLAGKARSGYEAIKLVYELKPDVVFMDINMPGIDGLDTIAELHDKFPDTVFVLSTAYERFDLARRAIPLGVSEYLVKPVSRKTFVSTLGAIREKLDARMRATPAASPVLEVSAEERFIKEALWAAMSESEWHQWKRAMHLASDRGIVCAVKLDAERNPPFSGIADALALRYRLVFAVVNGIGVYFFSGDIDPAVLAADLERAISSLSGPGFLSVAGFGSLKRGPELFESCTEALADLERKRGRTEVRLCERMRVIELRRKMGLSEISEMQSILEECWNELSTFYGFIGARSRMVALFTLLVDDCCQCYQNHAAGTPPFDPALDIPALETPEAWKEWAVPALSWIWHTSRVSRTGAYPVPLIKAIAFVESNYMRQIQLSDVADAAGVSGAYISKLFSEHAGANFVDYLTVLRIEKAEKMLLSGDLSIKEIAAAVGYVDPNYFGKIFRKLVGASPSLYAGRKHEGKQA